MWALTVALLRLPRHRRGKQRDNPKNRTIDLPAVPAAQPLQAGRQEFTTELHGGTEKKRLLEVRLCQTQSMISSNDLLLEKDGSQFHA